MLCTRDFGRPIGFPEAEIDKEINSPVRLLAAYDRDRHGHPPIPYHVYKLVFLCQVLNETPSPDVDTDGARFFGEKELPKLSISRVTRAQISRFFEQHRYLDLPADFD